MAEQFADLEIAFRWVADQNQSGLDVGLRFILSDRPVDDWRHSTKLLEIDLRELAQKVNDVDAYAEALTRMVFSREDIAEFYTENCARAQDRPIHLRVNLDAPPAMHRVRWELLRDPRSDYPVATSDGIFFSRYLSSPDFRLVSWRTKQATRALVVIASPSDIDKYAPGGRRLAEVKMDVERSCAEAALGDIETVWLAGPGQATLANLASELEKQVDILYLVCHGAVTGDVPFIFLEKPDGTADTVEGRRLAETVFSLTNRPTLAMLNSCQSAGPGGVPTTTDEGVLAGLGPRLAGAGIATVIAMQGDVSMDTAQLFAKRFFEELRSEGMVDRAAAVARRLLREHDRPDWWVPALFSRVRSGRTYFKAEFVEDGDETWVALQGSQASGRFTPVLGPGMTDGILGSRQEIAQRWADRWQMSIVSHHRDDLAKVAQYLRVEQKVKGAVVDRMDEYLKEEIHDRIVRATPGDPFYGLALDTKPEPAILHAGKNLLADEGDVYRTVAAMPVQLFVTTNWTQLLEQALLSHTPRKVPTTVYFPWKDDADWPESPSVEMPTVETPLVYHLFGRMEDPDSLVLTEDDYFEWLTAWISREKLIPPVVKKRLVNRSLLFLGHRLDDWEFKVVFEAIKSFSGSGSLKNNKHVGVQLAPGTQVTEPAAAQNYLESYLGSDEVSIYWSDTRKFLDEYRKRTGMKT